MVSLQYKPIQKNQAFSVVRWTLCLVLAFLNFYWLFGWKPVLSFIDFRTYIHLYKYQIQTDRNQHMSHPHNPHNQNQPLHITNSQDFNIEQITQRIQQSSQYEQENLSAKSPTSHKHQPVNILLQGLQNIGKHVTHSEIDGHMLKYQQHQIEQSIPEPLESDQQQSQQAQYLSYLQNQIVYLQQEEASQPSAQLLRHKLTYAHRNQFLTILYQAMVYVRKEDKRTKIDDQLLADRLNEHFTISTTPTSNTQIGNALLVNGYFLVAFAVLLGRVNRSEVLFRYVMEKFKENIASIEDNLEDFNYYANKPNEYFQINTEQLLRSSHRASNITIEHAPKPNLKRTQPNTPNYSNQHQNDDNNQNHTPNNNKQSDNKMKSTKITNITSHNKKDYIIMKHRARESSPDC